MRNEDNNTDRKRDNEGKFTSDRDARGESHGSQQGSLGRADQADRKRDEQGQFISNDSHASRGNQDMDRNKRPTGL